jgi:hypothetical protein
MPDLKLGVGAESHNEPKDMWSVAPTQSIAFTANRQVVFNRMIPPKVVMDNMIGLPAFASAIAANVTCASGFGEYLASLRRGKRPSPRLAALALLRSLAESFNVDLFHLKDCLEPPRFCGRRARDRSYRTRNPDGTRAT